MTNDQIKSGGELDLRPWGYAPGGYFFKCIDCPETSIPLEWPIADKRSWRCKEHALVAREKTGDTLSRTPSHGRVSGEAALAVVREMLADGLVGAAIHYIDRRALSTPPETVAAPIPVEADGDDEGPCTDCWDTIGEDDLGTVNGSKGIPDFLRARKEGRRP